MRNFARWLVGLVVDPLILASFGWRKAVLVMHGGQKFTNWIDPVSGFHYLQSTAIEICEARLKK